MRLLDWLHADCHKTLDEQDQALRLGAARIHNLEHQIGLNNRRIQELEQTARLHTHLLERLEEFGVNVVLGQTKGTKNDPHGSYDYMITIDTMKRARGLRANKPWQKKYE